jgi:hypothetical protein
MLLQGMVKSKITMYCLSQFRGSRWLLVAFISLLCYGCAGNRNRAPQEISVHSIIIDHENPQADLKSGDDLTVHFNKKVPIGSTFIQRLEMIFVESEDQDIRGKISSKLVGECTDSANEYYCVNKEVVGRTVEINLEDIERINVWEHRAQTMTYRHQTAGDVILLDFIVIRSCLLTFGACLPN